MSVGEKRQFLKHRVSRRVDDINTVIIQGEKQIEEW